MAVTNYHSGIDVTYGGVDGTDFKEEYWYNDPKIYSRKSVQVKAATQFTMANNARNVASATNRQKVLVGSGANTGLIRFQFDKLWSRLGWSTYGTASQYPAYSAPFSMSSLNTDYFGSGQNLIGSTGGNGQAQTNKSLFFYRGIIDGIGDEWHILRYAHDDYPDYPNGGDQAASDGAWIAVNVNPLAPAFSPAPADGTGKFYSTPAWVNLVPVIYDQTTYFQGNVNFVLTNIFGANISYKIGSNPTVDVGAATVTLTQANFAAGSNTIQYWYTATPGVKRTRTVVKNPGFPSAGEVHGNLLWSDAAGFATVASRVARAPYNFKLLRFKDRNSYETAQSTWDIVGGNGYRLGTSVGAAYESGPASTNAFLARLYGNSYTLSGSSKTCAQYAKEMMLESGLNNPAIGFELAVGSVPQATSERNHRGYWDAYQQLHVALAYDWACAYFRSDQDANGMTPIEDYLARDLQAGWNFECLQWLGDFYDAGGPGMWGLAKATSGMVAAQSMKTYSTPYFGTCGLDGNTTVYPWTPFKTTNYTWEKLFLLHNYTLGAYPDAPVYPFGWEGSVNDLCLCNTSGQWTDRRAYSGDGQMAFHLAVYRNFQAMYVPGVSHAAMDLYLSKVTAGTAEYLKAESGDGPTPPYGPFRLSSVGCLSSRFPTNVTNALAYATALPDGDDNSIHSGIDVLGLQAFAFFDDVFTGLRAGRPGSSTLLI